MIIPHDKLSAAALRGLVEEFVTRDGTDLTDASRSIERVIKALAQGLAVIEYDEEEGTTNIMPVQTKGEERDSRSRCGDGRGCTESDGSGRLGDGSDDVRDDARDDWYDDQPDVPPDDSSSDA